MGRRGHRFLHIIGALAIILVVVGLTGCKQTKKH